MKRWRLLVLAFVIALSSAVALRSHIKSEAREKRGVGYQSVLQAYAQSLKPGLPRKQVEKFLRAKGATYTQMCCIEERSAFADLVKVGEEDHPWFCSENYVHVAFEFAATEPHHPWELNDTDVLKRIRIFHQFGGCL